MKMMDRSYHQFASVPFHGSLIFMLVILRSVYQSCMLNNDIFNYTLHKIDPWFNYRASKYLSENGWHAFFHWFDRMSWYPLGRPVGTTIYPGLQLTAVGIHRALEFLGYPMPLEQVCALLPVWCIIVSTTFIFLFSLEVFGNPLSALLAAYLFTCIPAQLFVSMAGEFSVESISVALTLMTVYFWVRSLRSSQSWPFGVAAGLAYGCLSSCSAYHTFSLNLMALHATATAVINATNTCYLASLMKSYSLFFVIGTSIAMLVPPVGLTPLNSLEQVSAVIAFIFLMSLHCVEKARVREKLQADDRKAVIRVSAIIFLFLAACITIGVLSAQEILFASLRPEVAILIPGMTPSFTTFYEKSMVEAKSGVSGDYMYVMYQSPVLMTVMAVPLLALWLRWEVIPSRIFLLIALTLSLLFLTRSIDGEVYCAFCAVGAALVIHVSTVLVVKEISIKLSEIKTTEALEKVSNRKRSKKERDGQRVEKNADDISPFDLEKALEIIRQKSRFISLTIIATPLLLSVFILVASGFFSEAQNVLHFSNPGVVYLNYSIDGTSTWVSDYLDSYNWVRENTPLDARVFTSSRPSIHVSSIAQRIGFGSDNEPDASYHAMSSKILLSRTEESHKWLRHLADYVLLWTGSDDADYRIIPFFALVSKDFYLDVCPGDPDCTLYFPLENGTFSKTMRDSLVYQLSFNGGETAVPTSLFQEVYTSKNSLVRVYKVMNVSKESKFWTSDPENHLCFGHSWICQGQYPPADELNPLLSQI